MVAHDSKIIHGSFPNNSKKSRSAFIVSYVTKNSKMDNDLRHNYEKKLQKIHKSI